MTEIDSDAVFKLMGQLTPKASTNRHQGDSREGDVRGVFYDELTPFQLVAARGLLGWSQTRLAEEAGLNLRTVQCLETREGIPQESTISSVYEALVVAGIEFTANGKGGIGVWLER
jgi:ribosome-binding protein aMBF1 (putative translation factor)